jgi:hypothetical protein
MMAACVALAGACAGPEFTATDCDEANCSGASTGGSSSGGTSNGGTISGAGEGGEAAGGTNAGGTATGGSSSGTNSGGSATGGTATGGTATGGTATGGTATGGAGSGGVPSGGSGMGGFSAASGSSGAGNAGTAGTGPVVFPSYGLLDDFEREGPGLGSNWIGGTVSYEIAERALRCAVDNCQAVFWAVGFGVEQEVFATFASFANTTVEINLILKAQGNPGFEHIELFYSPVRERLSVEGYWDAAWHTFGFVDIVFVPGDELGGRVGADGFVDLFRNRIQVGRFDANDYPFIDVGGRIGVSGIVGTSTTPDVWDDFGGGGR